MALDKLDPLDIGAEAIRSRLVPSVHRKYPFQGCSPHIRDLYRKAFADALVALAYDTGVDHFVAEVLRKIVRDNETDV